MDTNFKLAFVHIPKTGGGSVLEWFKRNNIENHLVFYGHKKLYEIQDLHNGKIDYSFVVVRNTYERLISAYEFTYEKAKKKVAKNNNVDINKKILEAHEAGIVEFVKFMHSIDHTSTQSQLQFSLGVDCIVQSSELEKPNKLNSIFNINDPIKKERRVLDYNDEKYYTEDYIDTVYNLYKTEIDFFGYKPKYDK